MIHYRLLRFGKEWSYVLNPSVKFGKVSFSFVTTGDEESIEVLSFIFFDSFD
ncbi:hypothetical protein Pla110_11110 [Polystyrenella longa]|uniref:Uncharacterized protein n=1 Tax=Polystyrenella longa TaxID=2528007 RepID=A0A518CJJ2_9PLAN|nr:hypothetical protein Pla110_11110 [Polystyrenella longa]